MAMASKGAVTSTTSTAAYDRDRGGASSLVGKLRCMTLSPSKKKQRLSYTAAHSLSPKSKVFDRVFRYFDDDGDGKVSPWELRACMENVSGHELTMEEAEEAVRWADTDGDGLLGFEEFVSLVDEGGEEEKGRSLKEAFEVYEKKGRGCITAKSLRAALRVLGDERSVEECKAMIRKFDENGDGVISFDEFRNMMI